MYEHLNLAANGNRYHLSAADWIGATRIGRHSYPLAPRGPKSGPNERRANKGPTIVRDMMLGLTKLASLPLSILVSSGCRLGRA